MKNILLYFALLFFPASLSAQENIEKIYAEAEQLNKSRKPDEALPLFKKALTEFKKKDNPDRVAQCAVGMASCYYKQGAYQNAINILNGTNKYLAEKKVSPLEHGKMLIYLGLVNNRRGNHNASLEAYEAAITIYEKNKIKHSNVAFAYKNAAQLYNRRLDYNTSIAYFMKAFDADETDQYFASNINQLASVYLEKGDLENAVYYYEIGEKKTEDKRNLALLKMTGSDIYYKKNDTQKAEKLLLDVLALVEKNPDMDVQPRIIYKNLGDIKRKQRNDHAAENYYIKSLELAKKEFRSKNREMAKIHSDLGMFYHNRKKYDLALDHFQKALIQLFPRFQSNDIKDNPPAKDIYTESWIMTTSAYKGMSLKEKFEQEKDVGYLLNAATCFDLSLHGIKKLTHSYRTDNSKINLSSYSHNYFEQAIEVNYLLFKNTGKKKYLEKIFSIMERSKASVLTAAIQKSEALILADIPDSLLQKEKKLRLDLAEINTQIKKEELYETEADQEHISNLQSKSVSQQRRYETLLASLRKNYPAFNSFTATPKTPTIIEMQNYLAKKEEVLLEYFVGKENIYLLKIDRTNARVYQWPHTDFWDDQVRDFQDYFRNSSAIINDPDGYFSAAESVYKQVFPFDSLPEKIIIIPDESLNFIPFDALVAETPEHNNFDESAFLIKHHLIRYAYSGGLLLRPVSEKRNKRKMLRVEPRFANRERGQAPLFIRQESTLEIKNLHTLAGAEARLATFKELAPQCRLIEFFTHAGADETDFAPRIEFIDTSLYLPELYALDIPAELVVLSACETGLGKFEKGEGVMSLARGFAYAGAGNLVASLWKVNESSTTDLTDNLYQHLMDGKSNAMALRAAKLQYLAGVNSDVKLSPYYWAGFISIGPDTVMDFSPQQWYWWGLPIFGLLLIWRWRNGKRLA